VLEIGERLLSPTDTRDPGSEEPDGVFHGQDPFLVGNPETGKIILFQSHNYRRLTIRESDTIEGLRKAAETTIWKPRRRDTMKKSLWAPEGHTFPDTQWERNWFVSFAASPSGNSDDEEPAVLMSEGRDPRGPYVVKNRLMPGKWGIDLTYFQDDDQLYGIWSGRLSEEPFPQGILIAPMTNPWTLLHEEAVCISSPNYSWEMQPEPINEGPQIRRKNGKVQLIFAASGSWTENYIMGVSEKIGSDPMKPSSWRKRPVPIYERNHGHGHTIDLKDGREVLVAGRKLLPDDGWEREIVWVDVEDTALDKTPALGTEVEIPIRTSSAQSGIGFTNVA
jgi:GH43 family beta-xylosidase